MIYTIHHPFTGRELMRSEDLEKIKAEACKHAERIGADIDIYDEEERIVGCTDIGYYECD